MTPRRSTSSPIRRFALPLVTTTMLLGACSDPSPVATKPTPTSPPIETSESVVVAPSTDGTATTDASPPSTAPQPAPATPTFTPGPCPTEIPTASLGVDCGTVDVPQNRSHPAAGTVTLAVMLVRAGTDESLAPVVYLPGGPGDSAVSTIAGLLSSDEAIGIFGGRDWIAFDPRGTGFSTPTVACPTTDDAPADEQIAVAADCASRLTDAGVDLTTYNTSTLAADAAAVRTALGIDRWNLLGVSYGSRVALELLRTDADGVDAAVLDGVYPPTQGFNDSLDERPTAAFQQLFADCLAQAACATAFPDLESRVIAMIDRLNAAPVEHDGFTFTGDFAIVVAARAMYHYAPGDDEIHSIPYALSTAADGDFTALGRLAALNFGDGPSSVGDASADTTVGMGRAVQCHDEIPFLDRELAREQATQYPFGGAFGRFDGDIEFDICPVFGAGAADPSFRLPVVADVPTLMFTGTYDPTTPTRWADEAASTLAAAQVIRFAGVGHVVINTGACPLVLMQSFLADPATPLDLTCVSDYTSPEFDVVAS